MDFEEHVLRLKTVQEKMAERRRKGQEQEDEKNKVPKMDPENKFNRNKTEKTLEQTHIPYYGIPKHKVSIETKESNHNISDDYLI